MSEALAVFRSSPSKDLKQLSEEHLQHDLNQEDRNLLKRAGGRVSTHAGNGETRRSSICRRSYRADTRYFSKAFTIPMG
ncbi:hypothetical protein M3J09_009155 [Ascochyta lentis]